MNVVTEYYLGKVESNFVNLYHSGSHSEVTITPKGIWIDKTQIIPGKYERGPHDNRGSDDCFILRVGWNNIYLYAGYACWYPAWSWDNEEEKRITPEGLTEFIALVFEAINTVDPARLVELSKRDGLVADLAMRNSVCPEKARWEASVRPVLGRSTQEAIVMRGCKQTVARLLRDINSHGYPQEWIDKVNTSPVDPTIEWEDQAVRGYAKLGSDTTLLEELWRMYRNSHEYHEAFFISIDMAGNKHSLATVIREACQMWGGLVHRAAAMNPVCPEDLLLQFIEEDDDLEQLLGCVAVNPAASPDVLRRVFAKTGANFVLQSLASNKNTPRDVLEAITASGTTFASQEAQEALAKRK